MIARRTFLAGGVAGTATLVLVGCGTDADVGDEPVGDPVAGGIARVLTTSEPRGLDPAVLANTQTQGLIGNSLYGTLMVNDVKTGGITYTMAESFTTNDNGATFELKLRDGLTFSDGSPLDAEAVKFNWDRLKDPAVGAFSIKDATSIESTTVVDSRTLKVALKRPIPEFARVVVPSSMNWISSPAAIQDGEQSFNANPIGAGPFTLKSWTRQGKIEFVKNPNFWDAPKPYLDGMTLQPVLSTTQRLNTLVSDGADLSMDMSWSNIAKARESGLSVNLVPLDGGQYLAMNLRKAPFNDLRARQAVAAALDLKELDLAVFNGEGRVPTTLFGKSSPFYENIPLTATDTAAARRLFNELAAEGKKVSVSFVTTPNVEPKTAAEAVQAQLSTFPNVDVTIRTVELAEFPKIYATNDFDMIISAVPMTDPEPQLWQAFHGDSSSNRTGVDDRRLNEALDQGRMSTAPEERKAAYRTVQQRLAELVPSVFYTRIPFAVDFRENVHGVVQYGLGSLLPEQLWLER